MATQPGPTSDTPSQPDSAPPPPTVSQTPSKSNSAMSALQKKPAISPNKFDVNDGLPSDEALNENTLDADPNPQDIGEYTEQLSDVSDGEDDMDKRTASRNALSTWYRRIQPLIRNKRVRAFAIVNTILTILNLILFLGCMVMLGLLIAELTSVNERNSKDKPCIYQWSEWGECNAKCRGIDEDSPVPQKNRTIIKKSIIEARGSKYKKCDKDLADRVDYAPCNTHRCARNLSSFTQWTQCFQKDVVRPDQGCYKMRDLPIGDYLIKIDTPKLVEDCPCPNHVINSIS